jgi:AcrR family transcriptional regulator
VGELKDRRSRKKAQTRELIRTVAQRRFCEDGFEAVTIADIARECDVAVQTVFNHFATKEELFFDGRTPWVDSLAESVRRREAEVAPLTALRGHLVDVIGQLLGSLHDADRRRYVTTLEASYGLRAHERELVHESELNLRDALLEAWAADDVAGPADPAWAAPVIAAIWVSAARSLILAQRPRLSDGGDPGRTAADARVLADRVLSQLELGANAVHGRTSPVDTGWPQPAAQPVLRAG